MFGLAKGIVFRLFFAKWDPYCFTPLMPGMLLKHTKGTLWSQHSCHLKHSRSFGDKAMIVNIVVALIKLVLTL